MSDHLFRRFTQPLLREIDGWSSVDSSHLDQELALELVERYRVDPPRLLGAEVASSRDGGGERRPGPEAHIRLATNRHYVAIQLEGQADLLLYWPDRAESDLIPVDEFAIDVSDTDNPEGYDEALALERHNQRLAQELWSLQARADSGPWALYTFLDLTNEKERLVSKGGLNPRALVDDSRARIEPIVEAIGVQTQRFFEKELRDVLTEAIAERRQELGAREAVRSNLTWPDGWRFEMPELELAVIRSEPAGSASHDSTPLVVEHRPRLDPASFGDVQRIIRVWADSVERHPAAFRTLHEDRLSDLLVATLNASLPGANREVYSSSGRADIFIRADVLREGVGPAKIFICESKIWSGEIAAANALEQLFGYLDAKDTSAVLIFFVRNSQPLAVRPKARSRLVARDDFRGDDPEVVTGWPILRYSRGGRELNVCIAFIDLPADT